MSDSPTDFVNPSLLLWARRTSALPSNLAARKIGIDERELMNWEDGQSRPNLTQLRKAAEVYRRPLALFFLPEPPRGFTAIADYRRHADTEQGSLSIELAAAIRAAHERRAFLVDTLEPTPQPFPVTASEEDRPDVAAARMRLALGISTQQQFAFSSPRAALRAWIEAVERIGGLVFQVSGIDEAEMRGISLAADTLPVILLNGRDAERGKIFSVAHELGHLALRSGGICTFVEQRRTETFCNRFAASLLMPADAFQREPLVRVRTSPGEWTDEELESLSRRYSVSTQSVLLRLLSFGRVTQAYYEERVAQIAETVRQQRAGSGRREEGNFWNTYVRDRGVHYLRAVLEAYHEGRATLRDTANALEVRGKYLERVEREAWGVGKRR